MDIENSSTRGKVTVGMEICHYEMQRTKTGDAVNRNVPNKVAPQA